MIILVKKICGFGYCVFDKNKICLWGCYLCGILNFDYKYS